MTYLLCGDTVK